MIKKSTIRKKFNNCNNNCNNNNNENNDDKK